MESFSFKPSKNAQPDTVNHILEDMGNEKPSTIIRVAEILCAVLLYV
jgi:hypothetical protein